MKSNNLINFNVLYEHLGEIEFDLYLLKMAIAICIALNTTLKTLMSRNQQSFFVLERMVFTKLMVIHTTTIKISEILNMDHSTIQFYKKKDMDYDKKLKDKYDEAIIKLYYKTEKNLLY
jgi:hypothetical protein